MLEAHIQSKLYAHWVTINYRKHTIFLHVMVFCSIMKVLRGETFVTKIISGLVRIKYGIDKKLILEIFILKEIVTCKDYVEAMWL